MKGVQDEGAMTQDEIAQILGISRERVGFIERQALRKLRKLIAERGLTFEDLFG